MRMKSKLQRIVKEWIQWNKKNMTGNEFAYRFGRIFKKECMSEWNKKEEKKACQTCGRELIPPQRTFCSRECVYEWKRKKEAQNAQK